MLWVVFRANIFPFKGLYFTELFQPLAASVSFLQPLLMTSTVDPNELNFFMIELIIDKEIHWFLELFFNCYFKLPNPQPCLF